MKYFSQKLISILLATSILVPSFYLVLQPQRAQATLPVFDEIDFDFDIRNLIETIFIYASEIVQEGYQLAIKLYTYDLYYKELVLDPLAWAAKNLILSNVTASIVNWANRGFGGNTTFVTNPDEYFGNIVGNATGYFFEQLGRPGLLDSNFGPQIQMFLLQSIISPEEELFRSTLSRDLPNYDAFQNNFVDGGWRGWLAFNQSNNNPYGVLLSASETLNQHQQTALVHETNEVSAGNNFITLKSCVERTPEGNCARSIAETPGKIIVEQTNKSLGASVDELVAADEISEVIGQVLAGLIGQLSSSGSFRSLSDTGGAAWGGGQTLLEDFRQSLIKQIREAINNETRIEQRTQYTQFLNQARNATTVAQLQNILNDFLQYLSANPAPTNPNPGSGVPNDPGAPPVNPPAV